MRNQLRRYLLASCMLWLAVIPLGIASNAAGADRTAPAKLASKPVAKAAASQTEIREFEVRVDNTVRGTHRLSIKSENDDEVASIQTDVKVDVIVYAYVFKSRATELWRDGRLVNADVRCDDNGKKRSITLKTDNDIQQISFNDKPLSPSSETVMSTGYWRLPSAELRGKSLTVVDVDSGKTFTAKLTQIGTETIKVSGKSIACRHFSIDGNAPAELWFDDQDRLVRQKSNEQGHAMELRLKQIRLTTDEK